MSEGRGIGLDRTDRPRLRDRHCIVDDLNIFPQLGACAGAQAVRAVDHLQEAPTIRRAIHLRLGLCGLEAPGLDCGRKHRVGQRAVAKGGGRAGATYAIECLLTDRVPATWHQRQER